jgi:hypothetical protein
MDDVVRKHLETLRSGPYDIDDYDGPHATAMYIVSHDDVMAHELETLLAGSVPVMRAVDGVEDVLWEDRERFLVCGDVDRDRLRAALDAYWDDHFPDLTATDP